jgi:diguanylate cyclase (GGDEF)-like protein
LAALDPLTGARSRRSGLTELAREMKRAERTSHPLTLLYVDVDGLKAVNDSKGHAAGDEALVAVVEAIQDKMRSYDLVVRMGGDEFICVLAGLDGAGATARVGAVTDALGANPDLPSATFGVAETLAGESLAELIERADADLYERRAQRHVEHDLP